MLRATYLAVVIALVALAFGVGVYVGLHVLHKHTFQAIDYHEQDETYSFINPLLFCQDQTLSNEAVNAIEDQISSYVNQEKQLARIIDASFYFRDLNGGPWAIYNAAMQSIPASLLKVPLALAVYSHFESDPSILTLVKSMPKDNDYNRFEHFKPQKRMLPGANYSVKEMISYMLQYSDNAPVYLLQDVLSIQEVQREFVKLGIRPPRSADQGYTMDVKTYASFFRILFSSTYLNTDNSEHLLSIMSQSPFTQGIVAGVPNGIEVAHKFGEMSTDDGVKQLHDCGIVYKPRQPYLICVMTKGRDYDDLARVIAHISKTVYDSISRDQ